MVNNIGNTNKIVSQEHTVEAKSAYSILKHSAQYLPLFYVVLVFLGYLNMQSYYSYFDIPIYSFISINEVIIPFLPIIVQLLWAALYVFIMILISKNDSSLTNSEYIAEDFKNLFILKTWRDKNGRKRFLLILGEGFDLIFRFIIYLFVVYVAIKLGGQIITKDRSIYENYPLNINWIILILLALMPILDKLLIKIMKEIKCFQFVSGYKIFIFRFMIGFFIINAFSSYSMSVRINQGKPQYLVEFQTQSGSVLSDSTFVYLGKTNDYLFMRNLITSSNTIYSMKEIHNLKMTKYVLKKAPPKSK
jgi:hypothetical protein